MPTQPQTSHRASTDGPPAAWSTTDLAVWTGMSAEFFRDEIAAGELRAVRFGRVWRIHVGEVTRYLANKGFSIPPIGIS